MPAPRHTLNDPAGRRPSPGVVRGLGLLVVAGAVALAALAALSHAPGPVRGRFVLVSGGGQAELTARLDLPEERWGRLRPGQRVELTFDAAQDQNLASCAGLLTAPPPAAMATVKCPWADQVQGRVLAAGATGRAAVATGQRALLEYALAALRGLWRSPPPSPNQPRQPR